MSNFLNDKSKFSKAINKFTMVFNDEYYENEFQNYKFEKKNLLVVIGISIFF